MQKDRNRTDDKKSETSIRRRFTKRPQRTRCNASEHTDDTWAEIDNQNEET